MGYVSLIAALVMLAGCTTATGTFCDIAHPIRLSQKTIAAMSDAEVKEVLIHNRTGAKLCRWRP